LVNHKIAGLSVIYKSQTAKPGSSSSSLSRERDFDLGVLNFDRQAAALAFGAELTMPANDQGPISGR
jgi:hypothetical protein